MTGEAHWIDPVLMILGALGVAFMVWQASRGTLVRRRQRRAICPHFHIPVHGTFTQDTLTGKWIDVERCSACAPENRVSCDKLCLQATTR
jgi:hypothetical protein